MITEDFAPSARRDEPKWWAHLGEIGAKPRVAATAAEQRSNRRKGPVRAVPAPKDRERVTLSRRDGSHVALGFAFPFGATS